MFQNKWFYLFCISMLPIVELRGGIPAGAAMGLSFGRCTSPAYWATCCRYRSLSYLQKRYWSFSLPCPVSAGSSRKSSAGRTKKRPRSDITKNGAVPLCSHSAAGHRRLTGSLVAAVLRMRIWQAFLVITVGVLVSGFITGGIAYGLFTALA